MEFLVPYTLLSTFIYCLLRTRGIPIGRYSDKQHFLKGSLVYII